MSAETLIIGGSFLKGLSQLGTSRLQGRLLDREAADRQREAKIARARTATRIAQERREKRRREGERVSSFVSSGITLEGSPTDVLADAAMEEELAIRIVEFEGEAKAAGLRRESSDRRFQARATRRQGRLSAFSTILGGVGLSGL